MVCGGKNWDLDLSDNRCWTYDPCLATWSHVLDLPFGLHGGVSGYGVVDGKEEFWIVGGGNGTASNLVFVRFPSIRITNLITIVDCDCGGWSLESGHLV